MTTLTVYSNDFDEVDSVSDGFCGSVFVEKDNCGIYAGKSLSEALGKIVADGIQVDEIVFNYRDGENQMFKRFSVV